MTHPALVIERLRAERTRRVVLRGVDLSIARGEWLALLGANGSGKSTLLDCCVGRLAPASGDVRVDGHSIAASPVEAKHRLGYAVPPERLPALLTARECLAVQAATKGLARVDDEVLGLAETLGLTPWLDDAVALMSYGTRQKVGALISLLGEPALVVLDETFNGLDPASALRFKRHLRERVDAGRCGVLLATHALDIAERWADRVALLDDGVIVQTWTRGEIDALRTKGIAFEDALAARESASARNT